MSMEQKNRKYNIRNSDMIDDEVLDDMRMLPAMTANSLYNQTIQIMGRMIDYKELRMIYACAIKEVKTKFEILNTEFNLRYHRNPITSIQSRLKSTASILSKIAYLEKEPNIESIKENIHDIAGVRIVCSYIDDVFLIADAFLKQDDIKLIVKKDYITSPKENGYRSLHLIVEVPVFLAERRVDMKVEVQIRTIAMDFWASLEHQLHYKHNIEGQTEIAEQLKRCAETISKTDQEMMNIRMKMETITNAPTEEELLFEKFSRIDIPIE